MESNWRSVKFCAGRWIWLQIWMLMAVVIGLTACAATYPNSVAGSQVDNPVAVTRKGKLFVYGDAFAELHLADKSCIALVLPKTFFQNKDLHDASASIVGELFTQPTEEDTSFAYTIKGVRIPLNFCQPDAILARRVVLQDGRQFEYGRWWAETR